MTLNKQRIFSLLTDELEASVLRPVNRRFFVFFFVFVFTPPKQPFRKCLCFLFVLPPLQLSSQKFIIRQKKIWRDIYRPPFVLHPRTYHPKDEEINKMIFHYYELLSVILDQYCFHCFTLFCKSAFFLCRFSRAHSSSFGE